MESIEFDGQTTVIAKDQPQYTPLPAFVDEHDPQGRMTFCWKLSPEELAEVNRTGILWHSVLTFGGPLQPQRLEVLRPDMTPTAPPPMIRCTRWKWEDGGISKIYRGASVESWKQASEDFGAAAWPFAKPDALELSEIDYNKARRAYKQDPDFLSQPDPQDP